MYIDTHCHLTDERYNDPFSLIEECKQKNVNILITVGYNLQSSLQNSKIAKNANGVYFTAGVHPDTADSYDDSFDSSIRELCQDSKCVAVGEIGLDYHYEGYNKDNQFNCFNKQILIAKDYNLPISIHSRDACKDTLDIVKSNKNNLLNGGVMHCYSYSKEVAKEYLDMGFYLSFGGTLTYKNSTNIKEVCAYVPIDRILTETDCPYLPPQPFRGQTNYPYYVSYVVDEIAKIKGIEVEEVAKIVKENAKKVFYRIK